MDPLYSEILLNLYRHPLNKIRLSNFGIHHSESNPLCGDLVEIFIKLNKSGTVTGIGWHGDGCAISQAGASLTTEYLKGKNKKQIAKVSKEKILELLNLSQLNPTRLRCALLALECVRNGLTTKS